MKAGDKEKLDQCLEILNTTDLGLSMVWLWTWSVIKDILDDETIRANLSMDELWEQLAKAVENGKGFSLEYGAEQHFEEVMDWLTDNKFITDTMFEEEE